MGVNPTKKKTKEEFINDAIKTHGDKYDYSNVNYINNKTKVCIICPEHGEFWQTPQNHLAKRGCPKCKQEALQYEKNIYKLLLTIFDEKDVIWQYKNTTLLGKLTLDFYIPRYNLAIEHHGSQHFKLTKYFGDEKKFNKLKTNDRKKYDILKNKGITLIYFSYEKYAIPETYFSKIYTDVEDFISKINEIKKYEESNCI